MSMRLHWLFARRSSDMPLGLTENVMPLKSLMKHHFSYWNGHNLEAQPIDTQISYCWLYHVVSQYITTMVGFKAHNFVASSAPSHCLLQLAPAETLSRIRQERLGKVCEDIPARPSRSAPLLGKSQSWGHRWRAKGEGHACHDQKNHGICIYIYTHINGLMMINEYSHPMIMNGLPKLA